MKVREIVLGKGRERRFRGPRKPRNKQIGFHQKMKKLLDKALKEEGTRIQHLEDLIIWDGSVGGQKAIAKLHQVETSPKSISIKWDGSPAVIFGRNENGEFVLTDKSGFGAKGYNGKVTSGDDLEKMFLNRAKGEIEDSRRDFASKMKNIWNTVESVIPEDFRGYLHGDLLWFATPQSKDGRLIFKPNVTTYSVDAKSDIGKKIIDFDVGIVVHVVIDLDGNKSNVDMGQLKAGKTWIMPPVYVTKSPGVDLPEVDRLESYLKSNANAIDKLLAVPAELKMADFGNILYTYINNSVKAGNLDGLGTHFSQWVDSSKLSGPKKERVVAWVEQNSDGFGAIFQFINGVMTTKNKIIKTLDSQPADIEASTNGQKGGEGYVVGNDVKLVNRAGFTAANMNTER
ncbi:MAG: hypothetical protein H8D95_01470 [Candidatus Endolissoclinum sp.]|nr:hypothetical protein [Candidatus Endolissoclinum sp.]